jgi:hypothetical protein
MYRSPLNSISQSKEKSGVIDPSIFTCAEMVLSPMSFSIAVAEDRVAYEGKFISVI